ncbi:MAG TPA: TRAM domain-containing protein, partial [Clostridia bacterium]|nr:TRAM domain-containing protein [Clostridia bacterium]
EFNQLRQFLNEYPFEHLGVFSFSSEESTPAALLPDMPEEVKNARRDAIQLDQIKISQEIKSKRIGQTLEVIIDELDETGFYIGRSQYEAPEIDGVIYVSSEKLLNPGDIVKVRIEKSSQYDLMGEAV